MLQRIPFEALSKTFRDAITITRRLGFQYLWIDSLCIVQGDDGDFVHESSLMGHIYSGCILNIVAADAPDGSIGMFFHREAPFNNWSKGYTNNGEPFENVQVPRHWVPYGIIDKVTNNETTQRAWCFQETLLAPRSLYFCESEVFWQCRSLEACESYPDGIPRTASPPLRSMVANWDLQSAHGQEIVLEWWKLVTPYSEGSLTYLKDKLVAISGIARRFCHAYSLATPAERLMGSNHYLAGHWRMYLEYQLLWESHSPLGPKRPRNSSLRAPSWSWASSQFRIYAPASKIIEVGFNIIEATVNLCTDDEYGEVDGGRLVLRCPPLVQGSLTNAFFYPLPLASLNSPAVSALLDEKTADPLRCFALPGWTMTGFPHGGDYGLILDEVGSNNVFRRVGSYHIDSDYQPELSCLKVDKSRSSEAVITII
jgi:heterokaryon incompatibility protein (HET)